MEGDERGSGIVEGIFIATEPKGKPTPLTEVEAIAGRGLAGDRYANHTGTWWKPEGRTGQHVTLIEAEAIEDVAAEAGITVGPGQTRRTLVTRSIRLADLLGQRFR